VRVGLLTLITLAACGRVGFGPIGGGDDVNPGDDDDATGDGGTAGQGDGGTTTPDAFAIANCGSNVIIDDKFSDMTRGSQWAAINTGPFLVTEPFDTLRVTFAGNTAANQRAGYRQAVTIPFTGICAIAEIAAVPSGSPNAYLYLRLGTQTLNVEMVVENGMVIARFTNGGTSGQNGNVAYNATNHRFMRIRESGGSYNFAVAPALTGPYQSLGIAGGAIISGVSPSSIEVGGATTTLSAAGAGDATFESVLLLGP
jgi:hypothetical protein